MRNLRKSTLINPKLEEILKDEHLSNLLFEILKSQDKSRTCGKYKINKVLV